MSQVESVGDHASITDSLIIEESATMLELAPSRLAVTVTDPGPILLMISVWPFDEPAARVIVTGLAELIIAV